jgi:hypothetical protein
MGKAEFRSLVWGSGTSRYWTYPTPSLGGAISGDSIRVQPMQLVPRGTDTFHRSPAALMSHDTVVTECSPNRGS